MPHAMADEHFTGSSLNGAVVTSPRDMDMDMDSEGRRGFFTANANHVGEEYYNTRYTDDEDGYNGIRDINGDNTLQNSEDADLAVRRAHSNLVADHVVEEYHNMRHTDDMNEHNDAINSDAISQNSEDKDSVARRAPFTAVANHSDNEHSNGREINTNDTLQNTESETARMSHIRIKNRRRMYLERNPDYFSAPDLELADPLQYDRCIRRFQTAAEREADGRAKGWSGVLEADLYRSEAKIAAVRSATSASATDHSEDGNEAEYKELSDVYEDAPNSKEEGLERWRDEMTMRFIQGLDDDFEYKEVDENDEFDETENREAQERWFEDEEPKWFGESESDERILAGETGIQDF